MAQADLQPRVKVEYTCPKCKREVERINRTAFDKMLGMIVQTRRYKCMGCFWEGLRIYRAND
jgi:DNA-directed RNA polymerase subunit RPC12/RpoP